MRLAANSLLISLYAVSMMCVELAAESPSLDWTPGMYWTYQTDVVTKETGVRDHGTLTFLVLARDLSLGFQIWYLAAITQWYDGTEIMATTSHSGPWSPFPWRRWPQVANYIPPMQLPDFRIQFRNTVGSLGLPWSEDEVSLRIEAARTDTWEESISLTEMSSDRVVTPAGSFDDVVCMLYSWAGWFESTEVESTQGLAWWAPQVAWWVRAEGRESTDGMVVQTYELALTDWGVLSAVDMAIRLADALSSTAAIDPELAAGLHFQLDRIGVDITTD